MKQFSILLALAITLGLFSCKPKLSKIDTNILEWINENAHNPESYEPISTQIYESRTLMEKLESEMDNLQNDTSFYKYDIKVYDDLGLGKDSIFDSRDELETAIEKLRLLNLKIDSLKKSNNPNSIIEYQYLHKCRIKVPLGGLMLKSILFTTDKDFNITSAKEY